MISQTTGDWLSQACPHDSPGDSLSGWSRQENRPGAARHRSQRARCSDAVEWHMASSTAARRRLRFCPAPNWR